MAIVELQSLPEVRLGHLGPVLVSVWHVEASGVGMRAMIDEQRKLVARYGRISVVSIASKIAKAPGAEVSDLLRESDREFQGASLGSVVVLLERGLAAIIARSFIAAASLISSNTMLVVKTLDEAAEKLRALPGQAPEIAGDPQLAQKLEAFLKR